MNEFKSHLKLNISTDYLSIDNTSRNDSFKTSYKAPVKRVIIDRRMRQAGSRMTSRFIDENLNKDE